MWPSMPSACTWTLLSNHPSCLTGVRVSVRVRIRSLSVSAAAGLLLPRAAALWLQHPEVRSSLHNYLQPCPAQDELEIAVTSG